MKEKNRSDQMTFTKEFPSVIKYMGSKTEVLDLIEAGFDYLDRPYKYVCDLFAGSATLSGALRNQANVISNDIQTYSAVFTNAYLSNYSWNCYPEIDSIVSSAEKRSGEFNAFFNDLDKKYGYDRTFTLEEFSQLEEEERQLVERDDFGAFDDYYLFTKNYSGTYWSYEQCVLIDSYRKVIDSYKHIPEYYNLLLACLMYAMAYNSQSTGHYAQYRVPETEASMEDILIYRRKKISSFFVSKYHEFELYANKKNKFKFSVSAARDCDCLDNLKPGGVVYADPPYCFVHYSRFYHILETLVKYDYPVIKYKGRYRTDRYQSEYCIKTEVASAFTEMFRRVKKKGLDLLLSYSNSDTNTINADELIRILEEEFNAKKEIDLKKIKHRCEAFYDSDESSLVISSAQSPYQISIMKKPYNHSRMGRTAQKTIKVTELLFIAKKIS